MSRAPKHECDRCGERVARVYTIDGLACREKGEEEWRPYLACSGCRAYLTKKVRSGRDVLSYVAAPTTGEQLALRLSTIVLASLLLGACATRPHVVTDFSKLADAVCKPGESWESCSARCALADGEAQVKP